MKKKYKSKTMWRVVGLENASKNDKNIYSSLEHAEMHAHIPSFLKKVEVIEINYGKH